MKRKVKFSESGALLQGKLFDDKGNRMGPSFSSKNGVRYRFYVSTALRGRNHKAGSVTRISAPEIEGLVEAALSEKLQLPRDEMLEQVETITVSDGRIRLALKQPKGKRRSIENSVDSKAEGRRASGCSVGSQGRPKAREIDYPGPCLARTTCLAGAMRPSKISPQQRTSIRK